jgi:transposase-like protein
VLVAVEKHGTTSGRVRMVVIADFKAATLTAFIKQHVAPGSTIYTDGLKQFAGLPVAGFKHRAGTRHRAAERRAQRSSSNDPLCQRLDRTLSRTRSRRRMRPASRRFPGSSSQRGGER